MRQSVSNKATPSITILLVLHFQYFIREQVEKFSSNCLSHLEAAVRKSNQNWMAEMK